MIRPQRICQRPAEWHVQCCRKWWEIEVTDWTGFLRAVVDTYVMLIGLVCSGPVSHKTTFHTFHLLLFAQQSKLSIGQRINQFPEILERDALPLFHAHFCQEFVESFLVPCCLEENRGCGKLVKCNHDYCAFRWPNAFTLSLAWINIYWLYNEYKCLTLKFYV